MRRLPSPLRRRVCVLALLLAPMLAATGVGVAHAQEPPATDGGDGDAGDANDPDDDDGGRETSDDEAYVAVSFFGGALVPFGAGSDALEQGLCAGARVGWTSVYGLGVDAVVTYSPLPRTAIEGVRLQSLYATAALTPRFTFGRGAVRLSLAGGGGAAVDRTTRSTDDGMDDATATTWAPAATGSTAIELHLLDGGGLYLGATYTRVFGDLAFQYAEGQAGLIFTF